MSAAEKTPHKCNGISVPEPRCDVEILMQIFCPMFPVSMPFGHQKPQQNKTVPETASTDKVSMIWWEANENYPSSHTQDVIYFHNHSPLFPFLPAGPNLSQISHGCLMTWQQLQELSCSGFDVRRRNYHCEIWDSFHAHSRRRAQAKRSFTKSAV